MKKQLLIIATLDTKAGSQICQELRHKARVQPVVMDIGVIGKPFIKRI